MGTRLKIFGAIGLVFVVVTVLTYVATNTLIVSQYLKIEASDASQNTARAVDALHNRVDQLAGKITDWSSWDDTYAYIDNHNTAYVISNLQSESLQSLGINFMLFYNKQGDLVLAKGVNEETGKDEAIPTELIAAFKPGGQLLAQAETDEHQGFLAAGATPLFLASKPILTSDGSGPVRGTLVFAEYLTETEIAKLADVTHLNLAYYLRVGAGQLPAEVRAVAAEVVSSEALVKPLNTRTIAGYRGVNDIYDRPLLIARVELPRTITQEANRTLAFYLLVISLVTFGALAVAIYMIHQITLRDRTIQLKNDFFSIASHELRTPLSVIRGNSSLILQIFGPKSEPKLSEIAQSIYDSSVRLNKIVSNFLDAARLEGGQLPLSIQPIGLEPPVSPVIKELRTLAEQKGLYVRLELPVGLPQVMVDPVRVQQVVYNLVGNALKFTEKGGVTVKAEVDVGKVVVSVTDTGRGMSESQQRMLFKRFQQIQKTDMTNGTGLGLYISKMLVEKMGGRIWLSASEEGKGSVICFSVPIATSG